MKILITGGAGFIGSHLAEYYLSQGNEVFIIDDLSTGSIENIANFKDNEHFHYKLDSIFNEQIVAEYVDVCDVVFHLAAAVGVKLIVDSPIRTIETNIKGTEVILKHAAKKGKITLLASTSEVYGKNESVPFTETDDMLLGPTTRSRWSYACSKAIDEFLAFSYWKEKKLPVIITRLFNTVGPRQTGRYGMVLPRFVKQAVNNEPITVYGDGTQSRCFVHVNDIIKALSEIVVNKNTYGEVFNLGTDSEITILNLAKKVVELTKSQSEIKFISYEDAYEEGFEDMQRRVPSLNKIKKLINYQPQKNIDDIILDVFESIKH